VEDKDSVLIEAIRMNSMRQHGNQTVATLQPVIPPSPELRERMRRLLTVPPPLLEEVRIQFEASAKLRVQYIAESKS
jgi:hypothetical protein